MIAALLHEHDWRGYAAGVVAAWVGAELVMGTLFPRGRE